MEINKHGLKKTVYTNKEVILSAGAIQSPHLLMLSGVGPYEHLAHFGIPTYVDLPGVGKNLQDHVAMGGLTYLFDAPEDYESLGFKLTNIYTTENVDAFIHNEEGPVYWLPEVEAMAFVHSKYSNASYDWPDIQLFFASYAENTDGGLFSKRIVGITDDFYTAVYEEILYQDAMSVIPLLMRPKSRGWLELQDTDIKKPPLIYPNYFDYEEDIEVLIEGAKIAMELMTNTEVMKKYNVRINHLRIPGCAHLDFDSDEYLKCQARHYTLTIYHPVGK